VLADRDGDLAPRAQQLIRDLQAGGGRADHERPAGAQPVGPLVVEHGDLVDPVGQLRGDGGDLRPVEGARREDDRVGLPRPVRGGDDVAVLAARDGGHLRPGPEGRVAVLRVALEERDELRDRHEAVRVVAVVRQAGQARLPVRRQQPQRVPALGAPGVRDLAALEHDVVHAAPRQDVADREAGVAGPDDDDRDVRHRAIS
jgi:hypothetical protein